MLLGDGVGRRMAHAAHSQRRALPVSAAALRAEASTIYLVDGPSTMVDGRFDLPSRWVIYQGRRETMRRAVDGSSTR